MNFYYIMRSVLFEGLAKEEVETLLVSYEAERRLFKKDELIYASGQNIKKLGLILAGSVRIEHVSLWGETDILTIMEQGKTFGEASACARDTDLMVDYVADQDCEVLFLNALKIMHPEGNVHSIHFKVASNLTALLAQRNIELARRAFVATNRTIRSKVLSYLSTASRAYGSKEFSIPYNREQLARYLGIDRSALSAELGRMKREGLIEFKKNRFQLLV